ncbi:hypothetical protein ACHAXS_010095 [Conticribra weissflogii]
MASGTLVDDTYVNDAVLEHVSEIVANRGNKTLGSKEKPYEENNDKYHKPLVILDGFPRNQTQASLLSKWPLNTRPSLAIHIDVPDDICITKLLGRRKCSLCGGSFNINGVDSNGFFMPAILPGKCQVECDWNVDWKKRDDDTAKTIRKRMGVYHEQTEPVLNYWREKDSLLRFVPYNGVKDMDLLENLLSKCINDGEQK